MSDRSVRLHLERRKWVVLIMQEDEKAKKIDLYKCHFKDNSRNRVGNISLKFGIELITVKLFLTFRVLALRQREWRSADARHDSLV